MSGATIDFDQWAAGADGFAVDMNQRQSGFRTSGHRLFYQISAIV